ncbi:MAG: hypothetical protein RIQ60_1534 [Pseudomonadota bacterium]|jgi:general secretion pathway protein M
MAHLPSLSRSTGDAPTSTLASGLHELNSRLQPHWQKMAPRERRGVLLAGAALLLLLVWMIAVQPALDSLRSLPPQQAELDRQWQLMLAQASEARELRSQAPLPAAQAEAALRAATERLGPAARMTQQGERFSVNLTDVPAVALMAWLGEVRSAARARVIEAQLRRSAAPPSAANAAKAGGNAGAVPSAGGLSGSVVLTLQRPGA